MRAFIILVLCGCGRIGFDPTGTSALVGSGHFGLAGMRERVEMAGGRYRLLSTPGGGTAVRVRLPRRKPLT